MKIPVAIAGLVASVLSGQTPSPRQFFDTYCITCHNNKLRTAGLALDTLDVSTQARMPRYWSA